MRRRASISSREDFLGRIRICDGRLEDRQQLVPFAHRAGALGRDQVSEELADDRDAFDADAVDGRFGVPGKGAADATDVLVRLAGQQASLAVALLPQSSRGERQQRQRAALALDLGQHLVHQLVVLEAVAALQWRVGRGLGASAAPVGGPRGVRSANDWRESLVVVAPDAGNRRAC